MPIPYTIQRFIPRVEHGRRPATRGVVIHTIEGTAESALNWFANPKAGGVGAHLIIGASRAYQVAHLHAKCWHAGAANDFAIGIEHHGSADWSTATWLRHEDELHISANRLAWLCHQYGLGRPRRNRNVWGHSYGGAKWGGHRDPGHNFPWDHYLELAVRGYKNHWGRRRSSK